MHHRKVSNVIPIFSSQLEKAREATDMANIRAAYAAVSTDVLTDSKAPDAQNKINYTPGENGKGGTYTATVEATQKVAKWQSGKTKDAEKIDIGGQEVEAVIDGAKWTVTGNVETGVVTIAKE